MADHRDLSAPQGRIDWERVPATAPFPGVEARRVDTGHTTVVRYRFAPGAGYPLHEHPEEQLVQVVSGAIEFELDGSSLTLGPGDLVHVPGGVRHGARCEANEPAVFLNIVVPRRGS